MTDLNKVRDQLAKEESDINGCFTGDCPHDTNDECLVSLFNNGFSAAIEHTRKEAKPTKVALDEKGYSSLFKQLTNEKQKQATEILLTALKSYADKSMCVSDRIIDDGNIARSALAEYAKLMGGCE